MKNVVQTLQGQVLPGNAIIAGYLFDGSRAELEKSPVGFLRALLFQILAHDQELLTELVFSQDEGRLIEGTRLSWRLEELMELFNTITRWKSWRKTILIVNALDESPREQIRSVLSFFSYLIPPGQSTHNDKLRLCFASRHYPNISLDKYIDIWAEQHNHQDIATFTKLKLGHTSNKPENRDLLDRILQANGIFLWVNLVTDAMLVADEDGEDLHIKMLRVEETWKGLDELYERIFSNLSGPGRRETLQVFRWVLFAARRLTPLELCFAVQFESGSACLTFEEWRTSVRFLNCGTQTDNFLRSRSRGLLEVKTLVRPGVKTSSAHGDTVHFIHQTVPEFLLRKGLSILEPTIDLRFMAGINHHQIAMTCLQYLASPRIPNTASMLILRVYMGTKFPYRQPSFSTIGQARAQLLQCHNSNTYAPYSESEVGALNPITALRLVFSELLLLGYAVSMLQQHLELAEADFISQARVWEFVKANTLPVETWFNFQAAFELPKRSILREVDWKDPVQCITALGLLSLR